MTISHQLMTVANRNQYWIASFDGLANISSVNFDNKGNVVLAGASVRSGGSNAFVAKLKKNGAVAWQNELVTPTVNGGFYDIAVDSADNLAVCGYAGNANMLVAKYNSSGALTWQKRFQKTDLSSIIARAIAVDSGDNIIFCGGQGGAFYAQKMDADGTEIWDRAYAGALLYDVALNSDNDVILSGWNLDGSDDQWIFGEVSGSTGASVFFRQKNDASVDEIAYGVAVDSEDNIITVGNRGAVVGLIMKTNSSGIKIFANSIIGVSGFFGVDTDEDDNIYVVGPASSGTSSIIAKFDKNGNLSWQRSLYSPTIEGGFKIRASRQAIIVTTRQLPHSVMRLPTDGSGSGTYGDYVYAESTLTVASRLDDVATYSASFVSESIIDDPFAYSSSASSLTYDLYRVKR